MGRVSVGSQAIARKSHSPLLDISIIPSGPETEMEIYENAASVIGSVVSGSAGVESPGGAKNAIMDHISPMISLWTAEVAHAVTGMKREKANEKNKYFAWIIFDYYFFYRSSSPTKTCK